MPEAIIRTSDRGYFKRCRELWNFTSKIRENWEPLSRAQYFEFGSAIHEALEVYYDPAAWHIDIKGQENKTRQAFLDFIAGVEQIVKIGALETEMDFREMKQLGLDMLDHYFLWAPKHDHFTPIYVEVEFEVEIPGMPGVFYQGRIDLIIQDEYGYWIVDHKAQPLDEKVLTPSGWTQMGEVQVGDLVMGSNGKPTTVTGVFPQGELECVEVVFSDGSRVRCSEDHLWTVIEIHDNAPRRRQVTLPLKRLRLERSPAPVQVQPVEFDEQDLPIHPYILGLYLGDGYSSRSTITLSSKSGESIKFVEQYLDPDESVRKNCELNYAWTLSSSHIRQALRELGLWDKRSRDKFVPEVYLRGSVEQRLLLLQGLMDADGCVVKGRPRFCTLSSHLVDAVTKLVQSLGGVAKVSWGDAATPRVGKGHKVNFNLPIGLNPFKVTYKANAYVQSDKARRRYITSVNPVGKTAMQCISVAAADGLYVTRDYILTHNTAVQLSATEWLWLNDQTSSYAWAVKKMLGLEVRGVIFNELRKKAPHPPRVLKNGSLSVAKNQDTTYEVFLKVIRDSGYKESAYAEFLGFLKANPKEFVRRTRVQFTPRMLEVVEKRIQLEAHDMLNNPSIYPTPSPMNCNGCRFFNPCLAKNEGSDYQLILEENYVRRNDK